MNHKIKEKLKISGLNLEAGFAITLSLSGSSAFAFFIRPTAVAHGCSRLAVILAYIIYCAAVCLAVLLTGMFFRRFPARAVVCTGAVLYSLGWIAAGLVRFLPALYLGVGLLSGLGAGALYHFCAGSAAQRPADHKWGALGILTIGGIIGTVFWSLAALILLRFASVFDSYIILGLCCGCLLLLTALLMQPSGHICASLSFSGPYLAIVLVCIPVVAAIIAVLAV